MKRTKISAIVILIALCCTSCSLKSAKYGYHQRNSDEYWAPLWPYIVKGSYVGDENGKAKYYDSKHRPLEPQEFQVKPGMQNQAFETWKQLKNGTYYKFHNS